MIIKRIRLKNIRSFEEQEIEFPKGRILLAGDIGSGKSSVLLALEFALFGLQTGFISGSGLLRKGTDYGEVEVELEIQGKKVKILRSLKRKKNSIVQDKGFLEIENVKEQLSPEELKARVLQLLNYPSALLKTKSNLLFRFTLYTPQEQMRQILSERGEERLNTLRRIFGIDKYKNVEANLEIFISKLKEKIKILEAQVSDLDELRKEMENNKKILEEEKQKLEKIKILLASTLSEIEKKEEFLKKIEEQTKKLQELKIENASLKAEHLSITKHMGDIKNKIEETPTTNHLVIKDFKKEMEELTKNLEILNEKIKSVLIKKTEENSMKKELRKIEEKIISMNICPTCKQKISEEYKKKFMEETETKIKLIEKNIVELEEEEKKIKKELNAIEEKIEKTRKEEQEYRIIKEREKVKADLLETMKKLVKRQKELLEKLNKNEEEISKLHTVESQYKGTKEELDNLKRREKEISIEKAKIEKIIESCLEIEKKLKEEIERKEKIVEKIQQYKKLNEWMSEHLIPLILKIEKNVMITVNLEFNKMFNKWFSMLVDNLNSKVDENFTPIIEQGGYQIELEHLSGGERTSAALSYRLALNQLINSLMSNLATKGLLILDEPTEGFSSEQLDKMGQVLDQLNVDQLLLVSHETKIENFVNHVLRFKKENNKSYVTY